MTSPQPAPGEPAGSPDPPGTPGQVRPARPGDVPEILAMIGELAAYERARHEVMATAELLEELLFGSNTPTGAAAAYAHVIDADPPTQAGQAPRLAGFALWFLSASTWLGRHGIYLEDLFVRPEFRGRGYGRDLMAGLAAICLARGYGRLEWSVLDWNTPAIGFYAAHGAKGMDQWTVHRLDGPALAAMAARATGGRPRTSER